MFHLYIKLGKMFFAFSLIVGTVHATQPKECYSCEGFACLRASKVNNKVTCSDAVDSCVTVFEGSAIIARGCFSSLPEKHRNKCKDMSGSQCHKCYRSLCNDKGAVSCLQCNSEDHTDCYSEVSKIEPSRCPVSTSTISYCYTRRSQDKVQRGCLTDTSEQLKCLEDTLCEMCIPDSKDTCNRQLVDSLQPGSSGVTTSYNYILFGVCLILCLLRIH